MSEKEKPKDPLIGFTAAKRSVKDGKLRVELSLTDERALMMVEELTKLLGTPRGKEGKNSIKLDIHVREKEHEGRKFDSGFAFVRNINDYGSVAGGPAKSFKQKAAADFDVEAKIAQLKAASGKAAPSAG